MDFSFDWQHVRKCDSVPIKDQFITCKLSAKISEKILAVIQLMQLRDIS